MPRWERSVQVSGSQSRFGRGVVSGCIENEVRSQRLGSDAPSGSGYRLGSQVVDARDAGDAPVGEASRGAVACRMPLWVR